MTENNSNTATDDSQTLATKAEQQFANDTGADMGSLPDDVNQEFVDAVKADEAAGKSGDEVVSDVVGSAEAAVLESALGGLADDDSDADDSNDDSI